MNFITAVKICFGKFATFEGRARRAEFWYFTLFMFLGSLILQIVDAGLGTGVLSAIFALVTLVPGLAVAVRRLHDTDRSGWWYLLLLVPLIGAVVLLIWFCARGSQGDNRFGADPLDSTAVVPAAP